MIDTLAIKVVPSTRGRCEADGMKNFTTASKHGARPTPASASIGFNNVDQAPLEGPHLAAQIAAIDAATRQPLSGHEQDRLRNLRK